MSALLLLYGIETPDADQIVTPPTPTPEVISGGGIGGVRFRRKQPQVITFNYKIEKDDEEVIILGDL